MAGSELKMYNFRLDDPTSELLDGSARLGHTNRSQALRDLIVGWAEIEQVAKEQLVEALRTLVDRVGHDGTLIVLVDADADGNPDVFIAGHQRGESKGFYEGLKGVGHVVGDKCHVFLDFGDLATEPVVVGVGDFTMRIPCAQMTLGAVNWPPNQRDVLRLPLKMLLPEYAEDADAPVAETVES